MKRIPKDYTIIAIILLMVMAVIVNKVNAMSKENDKLLIAKTIVGEARGELFEGKIGVAWVIINRYKNVSGWFGDTIPKIINKPSQFSCWNKNDVNRKIASNPEKYVDEEIWEECKVAANLVFNNKTKDPTGGAVYYMTTYAFRNISRSYNEHWAFNIIPTAIIGDHIFFIEDEHRDIYE